MRIAILIIEDNAGIRDNIVEILELADYQVYEADNGKTGVQLAIAHLPDIILCDIMMPELDGYGVLYKLNKRPDTAAIPFVFLTAKAEHIDLRKGMELGADDYLTKPFDDMELLKCIESRLKKKDIHHSFYSKSLDQLEKLIAKNDGLKELQKIIQERKSRPFKKEQVVYYEGDRGNGLYLLISGKIKTIKMQEDGRELMTGLYAADDYLGINVLLSDMPHTDTATALEDSVVVLIPKLQLEELLNLYPEVSHNFIKLLANNIREKEEQLMQLAYHSVRKKLADAIMRLSDPNSKAIEHIKVSRDDLAAMTGMASETVSRTLTDFKDEAIIGKSGSTITILDSARLIKMKN